MSDSILAFDLSFTQTGVSIIEDSKILYINSFPLVGKCRGEKLNCLFKEASRLIVEWEPSVIVCEDVFFSRFTATSFRPLVLLQGIIKLVAFRLNRSAPFLYLASEVRSSFEGLDPKKIKKKFVYYSRKKGYTKTDNKKQAKRRYEEFKKCQMVAKVNELYKDDYPNGLLTDKQHDIADSILLARHTEALLFEV